MFGQTLAIAWNTFSESIRQPIVLVMMLVATVLIVLSNPFAAFTMEDDQRMFIDIALSTVFVSVILLSAFLATSVINREIENRTVLTVISKPVDRVVFVLGKYVGVAGALLLTLLYLAFVFLLVERHGTLPTLSSPFHRPVLIFGIGGLAVGVGVAIWMNYFYGRSFPSAVLLATTPILALAYLLSLFFRFDFSADTLATSFRADLWLAIVAMSMAILILTAVAVAASTRLGQVLTLAVTLGVFMAGMLSDWIFGRTIARVTEVLQRTQAEVSLLSADNVLLWISRIGYAVVPNFQVFWLSDALTQRKPIPLSYMAEIIPYGLIYIVVALAAAVVLFERREVG